MALRFTKLDRAAIRRLAGGEWKTSKDGKRRWWSGAKIVEHGIAVERLADGDLCWSVNVMVDGRRIHRVLGTESAGVTRTQCEEFIEQAKTEARAGRLALPVGRKLALTVAAAADDYLKRLEESGGKNIAIKRRQLRLYLKPFFGAMRLDAVSAFAIDRYKKKRLDEDAAAATVNRELATLSHLFSMALEWKWIAQRPCRVKKLKEGDGRIIALSDAQCAALMRAAVASADPYCWLFVAFGLNTAMRHSEILAARFDELDLDNLRLFIPDAKAGRRAQPITPELAEILRRERAMRDDCARPRAGSCGLEKSQACATHGRAGWIFPSPHDDSSSGHRARMDRPFRDAVKAAGLDPALVTPHVMRHTAITALIQARVDLPTVQKISGHKTLAMVLRYFHAHAPHVDDAIKAIGRGVPGAEANQVRLSATPESGPEPEPASNAVTPELHRAAKRRAV